MILGVPFRDEPMDDADVWRHMKHRWLWWIGAVGCVLLLSCLLIPAVVYDRGGGGACSGCHEIAPSVASWKTSSHRNIACTACHEGSLSMNPAAHLNNFSNLVAHWAGSATSPPHLKFSRIDPMVERCGQCHQKEHADWAAGPHGATYRTFFLDPAQNRKEQLSEDCLRCHGMFFEESISHLVAPLDRQGPWVIHGGVCEDSAAIPCLACHQIHSEGVPAGLHPANEEIVEASRELCLPSLAFFDRRDRLSISTVYLPIPRMLDGDRLVKMSPDKRQGLCYQCHSPEWTRQAGSGDDRTGMGVHEGLSCLACHHPHNQSARASCAECHPRLSNCGLDVEKMDTTFRDPKSRHNIHFVKCLDCHPLGVPSPDEIQIH